MSSLDFCVCGGSKNPNQELCGECRMAEIEAVILKHTWEEDFSDADFPDSEELGGCGTCNKPTNKWFCKACYEMQEVICTCGLDYKVGCKCLPF